ncbi:hypothetical protein OAS39_07915 [Pirellulales bacterium]|nr:hypothetical protein [Pirellulales bacterium]
MGDDHTPYREGEPPPSNKHILARIVNSDGGEEVAWVDPDSLHESPVRHEDIDNLLPAIRWTWRHFGRHVSSCRSLEDWELGFMRDANPYKEVALWARAVYAYLEFLRLHQDRDLDRSVVAQAVMLMLTGRADLIEPPEVAETLRNLMANPPEALSVLENFSDDGRFIECPAHLE